MNYNDISLNWPLNFKYWPNTNAGKSSVMFMDVLPLRLMYVDTPSDLMHSEQLSSWTGKAWRHQCSSDDLRYGPQIVHSLNNTCTWFMLMWLMCMFTAGVSCFSQWIMWNSYLIIWSTDWERGAILASSSLRALATTSQGFDAVEHCGVSGWSGWSFRPEAPVSRRAPEGTYHTWQLSGSIGSEWLSAGQLRLALYSQRTHNKVQCACRRWCWNISFPLLSEARPENPSAAAWLEIYMKLAACTTWYCDILRHVGTLQTSTSSTGGELSRALHQYPWFILARKDECSNFLRSEARTNLARSLSDNLYMD